ncbi:MAG: rhamnulokinase [Clostridia bacterium]|nr:rhamnulokinase [Clostridia bacterium]
MLKMLAIDLGASSGRGIVGCFDGDKLTLRENHRFPNEPVTVNGAFRWDIMRIFHEIKLAMGKCATSDDRDIASMGIDTWGVDYGFIDKNGQLMDNPYNYRDLRTTGMQEKAFELVPKSEIYKTTGIQFANLNSLFQLLAVKNQKDPWQFSVADKLLFVPDLLNYFLTGISACEYTIASTSQMLDANKRDWAYDMLTKLELPTHLLQKIVMPGNILGDILPEVTAEIGKLNAKIVNVASHDTASAVVSVPSNEKDFVYISSGTWSLMGCEYPQPLINEATERYNFTNEGGFANSIRLLKNIMGLWLEQESKRQWEREGEKTTYDQLSDMAMASEPLKCFIDPDSPEFTPPGDQPRRIAEFCRRTGQYVPQTKGEIVRCIFESLAMKYRYVVRGIEEIRGTKVPSINIVGGGTKEAPLCQLTANACGIPVYAGPVEATAIGNLLVQAIAMGEIRDLSEAREVVRRSFEIKCYEPQGTEAFDEAYDRFVSILGK